MSTSASSLNCSYIEGSLRRTCSARQVADVEEDAAVRRAPALADLGVDRPRDVVAGRQLGRPPRVGLATLGQRRHPARGLLVGRGVLVAALLGQVLPHEPLAVLVAQDPALAADGLGHQQAPDARRPDHARRVELDELHVDELGAGFVGERLAVAAVLPRVRGDLVRLADAAGREDDRLRRERRPARPSSASSRTRPLTRPGRRDEARDRALHEHVDARRPRRGPGASGSSRARSDRRRGRGVGASGRRTGAGGCGRRASGRRPRPRPRAR